MKELISNSESFINSLFDCIPGMVGYWSRDLRSGFSNREYLKWFGKSQEEMQGIHMRDLLGDELFQKNETYIRGVLMGEAQEFERTITLPSGERRDSLAHYIPHRMDDEVLGFFVLVVDITERKRLEQAAVVVEEESLRLIGRELHDSLGQQIAAIGYQANALEKMLRTAESMDAAIIAAEIGAQSHSAVMQCKQIAQGVLPFEIESSGLIAALQAFASRIESSYEIACNVSCENDVVIGGIDVALNLYRIVQEAVRNGIHHGGAQHLTIVLESTREGVHLSICDDGCGFSELVAAQNATSGMGLKLMKYRAHQLGATIEFLQRPQGGMEVRVDMRVA